MTLTHPVIASMRDERDHAPRMSDDVPADGVFLVIDGSPADAEEFADRLVVCTCDDGKCDKRDRWDGIWTREEGRYAKAMADLHHGHVVPVRLYLVVGEVGA